MAKNIWNSSGGARYTEFWDAKAVVEKLFDMPLDWSKRSKCETERF